MFRTSNREMKKGPNLEGIRPRVFSAVALFAAYIRFRSSPPTGKNDSHHPAVYLIGAGTQRITGMC